MTTDLLIRGFFCAILSLAIVWHVFSRYDEEVGSESGRDERPRFLPFIPGGYMPVMILVLELLAILDYGFRDATFLTLGLCFGLFLHIGLYYALLLPLMSLLRRHISARTCALLWLLPNALIFTFYDFMEVPKPLLILRIPSPWLEITAGVWLLGIFAVLFWHTASHLIFRRRILHPSQPVTDPHILAVWNRLRDEMDLSKAKFRLVTSPMTATPLTIGLFRRSMRVVLPPKAYTQEELELILRHELIHLVREDSLAKFFLIFCTAMCWFNPLMWIAMKKSAQDLERSCDETVLLSTDIETRKRYAHLILRTAGDGRGFTTCLSASANSLRYRLRSIMTPTTRRSGALIAGLVFFLLCITSGYVTLAYHQTTGGEVIFAKEGFDPASCQIAHLDVLDDSYHRVYHIPNQDAFLTHLSSLPLEETTGNYSWGDDQPITMLMKTPKGVMGLTFTHHSLKLTRLWEDSPESTTYHLPEGAGLMEFVTVFPALRVELTGPQSPRHVTARLTALWSGNNREYDPIYENPLLDGEQHGIFGYDPTGMTLDFTEQPLSPLTLIREDWDTGIITTQTLSTETSSIPAAYGRYTLLATFSAPDGGCYLAQFHFDIGGID
ncbi:MAG: M56 family metallopeptidase [Clostridia bacterium]|nr:M56 family metallopeptidase [Clostridia bacterium]